MADAYYGGGSGYGPDAACKEELAELQDLINVLFCHGQHTVRALDLVVQAEIRDLGGEVMGVVRSLPPSTYTRAQLTDQLNSIITARGMGQTYGTVE